ncbi:MAG: 30S ribosomal protein S6 [Bacillota bacterium]
MNRYELTYIINTALEETARKELVEKFTELIRQNGGEIEKVDESWGKRRLAYPIDDMPEGYYVLTTFTALGSQNKEIQRNLENNDMILRYLIIKLLDKKQSVKPKAVRPSAAPARDGAQPEQDEAMDDVVPDDKPETEDTQEETAEQTQ